MFTVYLEAMVKATQRTVALRYFLPRTITPAHPPPTKGQLFKYWALNDILAGKLGSTNIQSLVGIILIKHFLKLLL